MFKSGFHNQGTTGVFVAAAAAARMLQLDAQQTRHALGIAGSQAAGLMAVQDGAMTKSFHSGRAAQSGVYGALLAQSGYTGIPDVLDGAYGTFFSAFLDDWSPQALTEDLGSRWHIAARRLQAGAGLERQHHGDERDQQRDATTRPEGR